MKLVLEHSRLPLLRVYWYDGASNLTPTLDQLTIAGFPNVKVRLGRILGGRQKGVDALLYRDLMTLAREHAVATAYLLAGDDDFGEGVVSAQEMGVRVVVLGVAPVSGHGNQSDFLIREADEHLLLDAKFLGPYFSRVPAPSVQARGEVRDAAPAAAREFAATWAQSATSDELHRLLGQAPHVPHGLRGELIQHVQEKTGTKFKRMPRETRDEVQASFFSALRELAGSADGNEEVSPENS